VQRRDAVRTRARILKCATEVFSEKGYDGARVDEIARRAGVSGTLLYHYFGSKDGLFVAVMEEAFLVVRGSHRDSDIARLPPEEAISTLTLSIFNLFQRHPEFVNLLNSENLHKARHIARSTTIRGLYRPLLGTLGKIVARGRAEGLFKRDVDLSDFFISITAVVYFYIANRSTLSVVMDEDLFDPARVQRRANHVVDLVLSYLRTPAD